MIKKAFLAILIFSFFAFFGTVVLAQSENLEAVSVATESGSEIFTRERETERIRELRTLYRDQVEVYRNSEKAFTIAKTNYQQVQTLSALEEAVKATQTVMMDRSRVLVTYLELVDAVLTETNGVELDLKNQSHTELFGLINAIKIHQENIVISKDRQAMAFLADEFEPISVSYQSAVYKALSLIRIGKIQEVHDKAQIIETDIIAEHESQQVSDARTSKRERAYEEIERNFEEITAGLVTLNELFLFARREGFSRGFYENILEDLSPVFAQISRSLDHLEELITL